MQKDNLYTHTREIDGFDNYFKGQKKNADAVLLTPGLTSEASPKKLHKYLMSKSIMKRLKVLKAYAGF